MIVYKITDVTYKQGGILMKFLHLSDIHYCPEKDGRSSRELREMLPKYIQKSKLQVDELFFTGDYRHAFLQKDEPIDQAAKKSASLIRNIANAAGITDMKHIHLIPGNHDRTRSQDRNDKRKLNKIKKNYSSFDGTFNAEDLNFLNEQFEFFQAVCKEIYGENHPWVQKPLHTYTVSGNMVLLYFNTSIMHNSDNDRNQLIIGNDYLSLVLEEIQQKYPELPIIVLAHHSIEFLEKHEREAVEQIFKGYPIKLYLCGDAHEVWWRTIDKYLEITMGCLKSAKDVQAAFLYGDTNTNTYTAYHWDNKFGKATGWGPYVQFNENLRKYGPYKIHRSNLTCNMIQSDQLAQQNDVILPWMKRSASYRAIFPKLFINPVLQGEKIKEDISYSELISKYQFQNVVFVGEAGYGKSTLLKYLYLFENPDFDFLYLKANVIQRDENNRTPYEKGVLRILQGETKIRKHKIILLDGVDEVSIDITEFLNNIIATHSEKTSHLTIWFGWRTEHYYTHETEKLRHFVDNVISVQKWSSKMANQYVDIYSKVMKKPGLYEKFATLTSRNDTILSFTESPFQLTLLVYLLENDELLSDIKQYFNNAEPTIYELYQQFFLCWLKKERHRKTSFLTDEEITDTLTKIAYEVYYGNKCTVISKDSAITDLLTFSGTYEKTVTGFYHRSFCAFFCANQIFDALKCGGKSLILALKQPFKNDVTDFVRSAICTITKHEKLIAIQDNLKNIYLQILSPDEPILESDAQDSLSQISDNTLLYLKNELIYLITRLPPPADKIEFFVELVYKNENDPYMKLDLAYGAVLTGPSWIALEYAKSLVPGETADLINRSWTITYFGDILADPYLYRDIEKKPWTKARNARLKHLQSSNKKAIRFRILEIPLLYCFYASREWRDVNADDLKIIQKTHIDCPEYNNEEKAFLKEQKEKLVHEFQKNLQLFQSHAAYIE